MSFVINIDQERGAVLRRARELAADDLLRSLADLTPEQRLELDRELEILRLTERAA